MFSGCNFFVIAVVLELHQEPVVLVQIAEDFPQGLKPALYFLHYGTTKQAAEKGLIADERPEEHTAGAEAHVDSMTVTARDPEGTPVVP